MKIFKLNDLSDSELNGQYTLNLSKETGLYSMYIRFHEKGETKTISPAEGFKGIAHIIKGELTISTSNDSFPVYTGEAFELDGSIQMEAENVLNEESIILLSCGASIKNSVYNDTAFENGSGKNITGDIEVSDEELEQALNDIDDV